MKNKLIAFCEEFADKVDNDTLTAPEFIALVLKTAGVIIIAQWVWEIFCFVMGA